MDNILLSINRTAKDNIMIQKLQKYFSFKTLIKLIAIVPYRIYHIIIISLIFIGSICNYGSSHTLPMFWILVLGFVIIVYLDIYSIKQTYKFDNSMNELMLGDNVLFIARKKLEKRIYSNWNWLIILFLPVLILPVVIYIIKCPLDFPIKIFAYMSLYVILVLCFIGYTQYVNLIIMTFDCSKGANKITQYDRNRPHKTDWIVRLASLTNKQSNLFFLVGSSFIALLYLITFTKFYAVQTDISINKIFVIYLWGIIAIAIVIMFPIFSLCSYISIKNLISKLVEKEINECNCIQNMVKRKKKKQRHWERIWAFNQIKILLLEKIPVYPKKPLVVYAISYIIAIINFVATLQAALSLVSYII